jgi:hypothetical protein
MQASEETGTARSLLVPSERPTRKSATFADTAKA